MTDKILYILTVLVWGTTWYAIKLQVGHAPAEISILFRFAFSALLLYGYCKIQKLSLIFSAREHLHLGAMGMGLGLFSMHYLFVFAGGKKFRRGKSGLRHGFTTSLVSRCFLFPRELSRLPQ